MSAERRRLAFAFLLSLLFHTLLLSLTFSGQGLGLPGFGFPWRERRIEAPDLRVLLVPEQVTASTPASALDNGPLRPSIEPPVARRPAQTLSVAPAPTQGRTAEAIAPKAKTTARAKPAAPSKSKAQSKPKATSKTTAASKAVPGAAAGAALAKAPSRTGVLDDAAPSPIPGPAVIARERPDEAALPLPAAPSAPAPAIAAAPGAPSTDTVKLAPGNTDDVVQERIDAEARERAVELANLDRARQEAQRQAAQLEAARIEAERQEAGRREAERIEKERLEAERDEAARQEVARRVAERLENARLEAERREAIRQEAERIETARRETERQEVARQAASREEAERNENARREAERQEAARQAAARQTAERQEAARREAERDEAARLDAQRQEAARREAARQEAARQEAERQEAARQEAQRIENARREAEGREATRQAAARQEAVRQESARQEAARVAAGLEEEARREERLRAIGRQLDEEAARRDAASTASVPPSRLPPSYSSARRGRLFGRTDTNVELILYAEAFARKIELNMTFDMVREVVKRPHRNPMVTVAIRSDGSVESVTFVVSSGVAEIDEAIRRVVQSQAPYQAFPPELARDYDVIEIRRTWHFDVAIRLY